MRIRHVLSIVGVSAIVAYLTWRENNKRCQQRLASRREQSRSNTKNAVRDVRAAAIED